MQHTMEAYNQRYLESEQDMLLSNIGRLSQEQAPHFMTASEIDETVTFGGSAGFQWNHILDVLAPSTTTITKHATRTFTGSNLAGGSTYQAGPFTAMSSENPTFKYLPIQGEDFAKRFESPLTDKFAYLFDEGLSVHTDLKSPAQLFAVGMLVAHGDNQCHTGWYDNNVSKMGNKYQEFTTCLDELVSEQEAGELYFNRLEGHDRIETETSESPKATDAVAALQAGFEWRKDGQRFLLLKPATMFAFLSYNLYQMPPPAALESPDDVTWEFAPKPTYEDATWNLPKDYGWKVHATNGRKEYALVPEDWEFDVNQNEFLPPTGSVDSAKVNLPYADEVVREVEPFLQNYVYFELRKGPLESDFAAYKKYLKQVQDVCVDGKVYGPKEDPAVVCGYLKIGDFITVMHGLADNGCHSTIGCPASSVVGIGPKAPPWADRSVQVGTEDVWVPAHHPQPEHENEVEQKTESELAERDRKMFLMLYKVYQMSLVDTSKLATGTTPITISK